jgi:ribosome-binding protein aMBF1 (putative translation factor)
MSVAVKMPLIEIAIRGSGSKKKLFLVSEEKAHAIETLLSDADEYVDATDVFPELKDPQKRIGITFRSIRSKTGLTQKQVAEKLGLDQADVSKIEKGIRPIGKALAKKIEKAFKIDYRRFL